VSLLAITGGTAFGVAVMTHIVSDFTTVTSEGINKAMDRLTVIERRQNMIMPTPSAQPIAHTNTPLAMNMRPGWIARVLAPPSNYPYVLPKSDIGTFVLDEIQFNLLAHEGHGIYQSRSVAYRLTGTFHAKTKGCHQFFIQPKMRDFGQNNQQQVRICKFRIFADAKDIVQKTTKLSPPSPHVFVAGLVDLNVGFHPIDVEIFCDLGPSQTGDDVMLSITTREPGSATFVARRDAFVHNVSSEFGPVPIVRTEGRAVAQQTSAP
jgi:hypothetical protein